MNVNCITWALMLAALSLTSHTALAAKSDVVDFSAELTAITECTLSVTPANTSINATYSYNESVPGQLKFAGATAPTVTITAGGCPLNTLTVKGTQSGDTKRLGSDMLGLATRDGGFFFFTPGIADFRFYTDVGATTGMRYAKNGPGATNSAYSSDIAGYGVTQYPAKFLNSLFKSGNPNGIPITTSFTGNMKGTTYESSFSNRCFGYTANGIWSEMSQTSSDWCSYYSSDIRWVPTDTPNGPQSSTIVRSAVITFGVISSVSLFGITSGVTDDNAANDGEAVVSTSTLIISMA